MITSSMIYWITRLDYFNTFVGIMFTIFTIATVASGIIFVISNVEDSIGEKHPFTKKFRMYFMFSLIAWIFTGIVLIMTPTTKEVAAMYVIPKIANNEKI